MVAAMQNVSFPQTHRPASKAGVCVRVRVRMEVPY